MRTHRFGTATLLKTMVIAAIFVASTPPPAALAVGEPECQILAVSGISVEVAVGTQRVSLPSVDGAEICLVLEGPVVLTTETQTLEGCGRICFVHDTWIGGSGSVSATVTYTGPEGPQSLTIGPEAVPLGKVFTFCTGVGNPAPSCGAESESTTSESEPDGETTTTEPEPEGEEPAPEAPWRAVNLDGPDDAVAHGSRVTLTGRIDASAGCSVGQLVELEAEKHPQTDKPRVVAWSSSDEAGAFSFEIKVPITTDFVARVLENDACPAASSAVLTIQTT